MENTQVYQRICPQRNLVLLCCCCNPSSWKAFIHQKQLCGHIWDRSICKRILLDVSSRAGVLCASRLSPHPTWLQISLKNEDSPALSPAPVPGRKVTLNEHLLNENEGMSSPSAAQLFNMYLIHWWTFALSLGLSGSALSFSETIASFFFSSLIILRTYYMPGTL